MGFVCLRKYDSLEFTLSAKLIVNDVQLINIREKITVIVDLNDTGGRVRSCRQTVCTICFVKTASKF